MTIISIGDLPRIREKHKDQKIVYCSGSFDLTHAGHILFFEDCKKHGDILVVSVGKDVSIQHSKGEKRPILNEHIRLKTVDSFKPVDYSFTNPSFIKGNPLHTMEITFEKLKPDIFAANEDFIDVPRIKNLAKKFNVKIIILPRSCPSEFENLSTTKIIEKIKDL